jgi:Fe-Mn family superoxide dismutase
MEIAPMSFTLKPLPYDKAALSPAMSSTTIELHYEKHHRGYVDKLNKLTAGTTMASLPLERVIEKTWGDPKSASIFDNAAQIWNHDFFWQSMHPMGGFRAAGRFSRLEAAFGSYERFEDKFVERAMAQFGSGWAWLVLDTGKIKIMTTGNALTPAVLGLKALLCCDLWEHAYYLDYQNDREKFLRSFLARLANWGFVEEQFALAERQSESELA